jgi:hypothetical protein
MKAQTFHKIAACECSENNETIYRYTEIILIMGHDSQEGASFL